MGQAIITSGGPDGLYNVTIIKHAGNSAARLAAIAARMSVLGVSGSAGLITTAETAVTTASNAVISALAALNSIVSSFIAGTAKREDVTAASKVVLEKQTALSQKQRDLSVLIYEYLSIEKEQTRLTLAMTTEARTGIWCTDLTEDILAGTTVGTMEMNGVDDQIIIAPGGDVAKSIGLLQHTGVSTGAAVFLNKVRLPAWQKWKPNYRVGTITEIDYEANTCSVGIARQFSEEGGLMINQSGKVYECIQDAIQGWTNFAAANPSFALTSNTGDTTIPLTAQAKLDLQAVQNDVQSRYNYKTDTQLYAKLENWTIMSPGGSGDCEDFALTKADKLLAMGYPASALHIEVGLTKGIGHAWLVVQTDSGDYALDINYQNIRLAGSLGYTNVQRQYGMTWKQIGVLLEEVPIEYMDGTNSDAFAVDDRVVVQFVGQNWNDPKVVGFETNPRGGHEIYATYQSAGSWTKSVGAYTIDGTFKYALDITVLPVGNSIYTNTSLSSLTDGPFVFCQSLNHLAQGPKMACEFWQNEAKTVKTYSFWQDAIASFYASKSVPESDVSVTLGGSLLVGDNLYVTFFTMSEGFIGYWLNGVVCFSKTTGLLLGMRTFAYSLGPWANYGPSPGICVKGFYIFTPDQSYDGTRGMIRITPITFDVADIVYLGAGRTIAMAACAGDDGFYGVYYNVGVPSGAQYLYLAVFEPGATTAKHTVNLPLRQLMIWAGSPHVKMYIYRGKVVIWFRTTWNDTGADEYRRFTCDPLTGAIEKNETGTFSNNTSEITIVES